ncbi:MAG: L,D-transpeptidase [Conexibacter sp.]|nr:L,D-transpeptidase [Conexibacter sp.]
MRRLIALSPALLALVAAAPAAAQEPSATSATPAPTTAAPAPTTVPTATPAPAPGSVRLTLERINGKAATVLAGDRIRVRGTVTPYVPGQAVTVRFYRDARKLAARHVMVKPTRSGAGGTFVLGYEARSPGPVTVRASHRATAQQLTMVAKPRGLVVLPARVGSGSGAWAVRLLQRRLKALGYVPGRAGDYDARTARAVLAFRKVTGMARTSDASKDVLRRLVRGGGGFHVRFPQQGKHVEADLSLQVMALIRGSKVQRIYPISSGKPSTPTILGSYRVYSKTPGTNAKGMVFTSYFRGGYGIHGYAEVPTFAASHGCLRTPVPDAVSIFNWISYGDYVDVYA